jgi:hypothetical protein
VQVACVPGSVTTSQSMGALCRVNTSCFETNSLGMSFRQARLRTREREVSALGRTVRMAPSGLCPCSGLAEQARAQGTWIRGRQILIGQLRCSSRALGASSDLAHVQRQQQASEKRRQQPRTMRIRVRRYGLAGCASQAIRTPRAVQQGLAVEAHEMPARFSSDGPFRPPHPRPALVENGNLVLLTLLERLPSLCRLLRPAALPPPTRKCQ